MSDKSPAEHVREDRQASLGEHVAGFASRAEILATSDVVLLPKPQHSDVAALSPGQVLWGWPHCFQDRELAGLTGDYARRLSAVVIGFGATARGAVTALNAHGRE